MTDEMFIKKYEELLDRGYCDCNEMNCIDNNSSRRILNIAKRLQQENQELKKQLEECYCNRTDCSSRIKDSKQYDSLVQKTEKQQKEFIDWLESESKELIRDAGYHQRICLDILSKYKEIIGDKDE